MATLLAKKSGSDDNLIAKSDDHHDMMASDITITAIPQGSTFGGTSSDNTTTGFPTGSATFGAPSSGGFSSSSSNSSSTTITTGFGGSSGFGATTPVFGNTTNNTGGIKMAEQNQAELIKSSGGAMSEGGESTVTVRSGASDSINKRMGRTRGRNYMLTERCDCVVRPGFW